MNISVDIQTLYLEVRNDEGCEGAAQLGVEGDPVKVLAGVPRAHAPRHRQQLACRHHPIRLEILCAH